MFRAYSYPLRPTCRQKAALRRLLSLQCELYNAALEERRGVWKWNRESRTRFDQYKTLTDLRSVRPDTLAFGTTVCRGTLTRLDRSFQGFFRRVKVGQTPGFPRFKSVRRFDSVEYPDMKGWKVAEGNRLYLQGIGHVKMRLHRELRGVPKTLTVRRRGNRWEVTVFCAEVPTQPLPKTGRNTGVDRGVRYLASLDDGTHVENLRPRKAQADRVAAVQRDIAARKPGSSRSRESGRCLGNLRRKEMNRRKDHLHKVSRMLVNEFDLIVVEHLKAAQMTRRAKPVSDPDRAGGFLPNGGSAKTGLNDAILDSGWGELLKMLLYKAEDAGREIIQVDPRFTSQKCSECGHTEKGNRAESVFKCLSCGFATDADTNAAINILRAGLALREMEAHASAEREACKSVGRTARSIVA